jgi:hypothetical protein
MKPYTLDSIGRLIDRNLYVGRIWQAALFAGDLERAQRCALLSRRLSRIVTALLEGV